MHPVRLPVSHRQTGFTLLEVAVALCLMSLALSVVAPLARRTLDLWAVRAVRDGALAALHRTRMEARIRGGAILAVDGDAGTLEARVADSVLWRSRQPGEAGVRVSLPDGRTGVDLAFDALGLGIVTSRTLVFRRGEAEARLVISSRGRASRR